MTRPRATDRIARRVLAELESRGVLLQAGDEFPSVVGLVAGRGVRGSWWKHPDSNLIYWVCQTLGSHPRVLTTRLLAGKVTHIFESEWADLVAVAVAREPWQWRDIDADERRVVARVDREMLRTDRIDWPGSTKLGDVCRKLERRLLVKASEVHTESGRHAKELESWSRWWAARGGGALPEAAVARSRLESKLGAAAEHVPWRAGAVPARRTRS